MMLAFVLVMSTCFEWQEVLTVDRCEMRETTLCGEHECRNDAEYTDHVARTLREVDPVVAMYTFQSCTFKTERACVKKRSELKSI